MKKKVKTRWFGSAKWFWPGIFVARFAEAGKKAQRSCVPTREECNEYDLTAAPCFWLANHNDWSRWFAISSFPSICSLGVSFISGFAKKRVNNYTWMWRIILQGHILSTVGDALSTTQERADYQRSNILFTDDCGKWRHVQFFQLLFYFLNTWDDGYIFQNTWVSFIQ